MVRPSANDMFRNRGEIEGKYSKPSEIAITVFFSILQRFFQNQIEFQHLTNVYTIVVSKKNKLKIVLR